MTIHQVNTFYFSEKEIQIHKLALGRHSYFSSRDKPQCKEGKFSKYL